MAANIYGNQSSQPVDHMAPKVTEEHFRERLTEKVSATYVSEQFDGQCGRECQGSHTG